MSQSSFGEALARLWPHGDQKIPGLRAGIIASAPMVFAKYGITTPPLAAKNAPA
jgi:putative chitinase